MPDSVATILPARTPMTPRLALVMATVTGIAVANLYYNQPMLGLIVAEYGHAALLLPTATQIGYAIGLVLLVPLGDVMDRRRLILVQTVFLFAALIAAAAAPGVVSLIVAMIAVGVTATIAQQIVPFAAELSAPEERGRTVGTIMSGLLAGILLARAVGGVVGEHVGWRAMFWLGTALCAMAGTVMLRALPPSVPQAAQSYPRLLASLGCLVRDLPSLRRASVTQGCLFGAFSVFWSTLALLLEQPPLRLGSTAAGLFGVIGLIGVFVAPLAGRLADRRGPRGVITVGILTVLAAFVAMAISPTVPGLVAGVVLLDVGLQLAMISNQAVIFALAPEARSRINTVFVTVLFSFGALGSAGASLLWPIGGWSAVCVLGGGFVVAALVIHQWRRRDAGTH